LAAPASEEAKRFVQHNHKDDCFGEKNPRQGRGKSVGEILALTLLAALPGLLLSTLLTALSWLLAWLLLPAAALLTTLVLLARLLFIRTHTCSLVFLPQPTTNASTLSSCGRWSASVQSARLRNVGMSKLIGVAVMKTSCATKDLLRRTAGEAWHAL
jgi:hypothetical protein